MDRRGNLSDEIIGQHDPSNYLTNRYREDYDEETEENREPNEKKIIPIKTAEGFCRSILRGLNLSKRFEQDIDDIVQESYKKYLGVNQAINNPEAYFYIIVQREIINLIRKEINNKTIPSGEVDIDPNKIIDDTLIPSYATGDASTPIENREDETNKNSIYEKAFSPLGYKGKMRRFVDKNLLLQDYATDLRNLRILQLILEGKTGEEIAKEIFGDKYDFDDPQQKKRAINNIHAIVHRYLPEILEEVAREIGSPVKQVNPDFLNHLTRRKK